jgi:hypothetical protein
MPYVNERWLGGMLTNFETIAKRVAKMQEYERMRASGEFDAMPKKEALLLSRELEKLEKNLGGIRDHGEAPRRGVHPRHQEGAHRRHRGQQARHPGGRRGRHQLRPRRHPVRHPRQRRRHPLRHPDVPGHRRRRGGGPLHRLPAWWRGAAAPVGRGASPRPRPPPGWPSRPRPAARPRPPRPSARLAAARSSPRPTPRPPAARGRGRAPERAPPARRASGEPRSPPPRPPAVAAPDDRGRHRDPEES